MSSRPILLRRNCGLEVMFYIRSHDSGDGSGTRALTCLSVTMVIICFLRLTIFFFLPHHSAYGISVSQSGIKPVPSTVEVHSLNH